LPPEPVAQATLVSRSAPSVTAMSRSALNGPVSLKRHVVHRAQRLLVNPVGRQLPGMVVRPMGSDLLTVRVDPD
jgi:hypothetical protein